METTHKKDWFEVTALCRDDLTTLGFIGSAVDDNTMENLARKLGDAYCESNGFDRDLFFFAEDFGIPKLPKD